MAGDDGVVVAVGGDRPPEIGADRLVEERDVGRPAVDREFAGHDARCSRDQISPTASRVVASTTNVFHVDTGEPGSATSSTVRYSAVHVSGVIVWRV